MNADFSHIMDEGECRVDKSHPAKNYSVTYGKRKLNEMQMKKENHKKE